MEENELLELLAELSQLQDYLKEHNCDAGVDVIQKTGMVLASLSSFYLRETSRKKEPSNLNNTLH